MFRNSCRLQTGSTAGSVGALKTALASHPNVILRAIFSAPPDKLAIVEECPPPSSSSSGNSGSEPPQPQQAMTYGQLCEEVVKLAKHIRREGHFFSPWNRSNLSSSDDGGRGEKHCENSHDETGRYNALVLAAPNARFVVSMLAAWYCGLMAVPTCHHHHLGTELKHVFYDSRSALLFYEPSLVHRLTREMIAIEERHRAEKTCEATTKETSAEGVLRQGCAETHSPPLHSETELDNAFRRMFFLFPPGSTETYGDDEMSATPTTGSGYVAHAYDIDTLVDVTTEEMAGEVAKGTDEKEEFLPSSVPEERDALMIYTSGTTAKPKGVVHTHRSLSNQVNVLLSSWRWSSEDRVLNLLPLHHVHGLVNILFCALAAQATCVMNTGAFNAVWVAQRLCHGDLSLLMAVPAIYGKLIPVFEAKTKEEKECCREAMGSKFRLMVSGSAALPVPFIETWRRISGHTLLERYGMTEVGMALSQPYRPTSMRLPGTVGCPLPTVEARVILPPKTPSGCAGEPRSSSSSNAGRSGSGTNGGGGEHDTGYDYSGNLELCSPSVFHRYWRNPEATRKEFIADHRTGKRWFMTGDTVGVKSVFCRDSDQLGGNMHCETFSPSPATATADEERDGEKKDAAEQVVKVYSILGRTSVDIIKSSSYKLSGLEIESALLEEPTPISEAAVFGVPCDVKGERIVAIVTPKSHFVGSGGCAQESPPQRAHQGDCLEEVEAIAKERLVHYKVPSQFVLYPEGIPRNAMGKVSKKDLKAKFFSSEVKPF